MFLAFVSFANAQYNPELFATLYTGNNPQFGVNLVQSTTLNNLFFFTTLEDDFSNKLYVSEGTVGNTIVLKNAPGVYIITTFNNSVYFTFQDPTNGIELWKTDGTLSGTSSVAVLGGNTYATVPYLISANRLYFASTNATNSRQLYVLDAGSNSPILLSSNLYDFYDMIEYNGNLIFSISNTAPPTVNRELYITDGTVAGTTLLKEIKSGPEGSDPNKFTLYQNKVFFTANDGVSGSEIWTTDGTENGTQLFKDINPGAGNAMFGFFNNIYNNKLFFAADDGIHGREFWSTDGTPAGTALIKDINPNGNSIPSGF